MFRSRPLSAAPQAWDPLEDLDWPPAPPQAGADHRPGRPGVGSWWLPALALGLGLAGFGEYALWKEHDAFFLQAKAPAALKLPNLVRAVAYSPDGRRIASGSADGVVRLWRPDGVELANFRGHLWGLHALAWSPDGQKLASASGDWPRTAGELFLWDVATGERQALWTGGAPVATVAFSADGRHLAAARGRGQVTVWDTATWHVAAALTMDTEEILALAFAPDGLTLAAAGTSEEVCLWDLPTWQVRALLPGHRPTVWSLAFAPDGQTLAATSADGSVHLWDVPTANRKHRFTLRPQYPYARTAAFSPDGRLLVLGTGTWHEPGMVRVWDVAAWKEVAVLEGHRDQVLGVAFAPDGRWLATASADQTLRVWDLATERATAVCRPTDQGAGLPPGNAESE